MDTRAYAAEVEPTRETKPLESIALAVQRVNTAQVRVSRFIDRFHGSPPTDGAGQADSAKEILPPYGANLQRLFDSLDRLESRIDELERIG